MFIIFVVLDSVIIYKKVVLCYSLDLTKAFGWPQLSESAIFFINQTNKENYLRTLYIKQNELLLVDYFCCSRHLLKKGRPMLFFGLDKGKKTI